MKYNNSIPMQIQRLHLDSNYPNSKTTTSKNNYLKWIGEIKPTPLSKKYKIKVTYKLGDHPKIVVLQPELQQYNEKAVPHRYSDGSLCLYRYDWKKTQIIANTIIPWTSIWLYYYEIWLATGKWYGGGEHPKSKDKMKDVPVKKLQNNRQENTGTS